MDPIDCLKWQWDKKMAHIKVLDPQAVVTEYRGRFTVQSRVQKTNGSVSSSLTSESATTEGAWGEWWYGAITLDLGERLIFGGNQYRFDPEFQQWHRLTLDEIRGYNLMAVQGEDIKWIMSTTCPDPTEPKLAIQPVRDRFMTHEPRSGHGTHIDRVGHTIARILMIPFAMMGAALIWVIGSQWQRDRKK